MSGLRGRVVRLEHEFQGEAEIATRFTVGWSPDEGWAVRHFGGRLNGEFVDLNSDLGRRIVWDTTGGAAEVQSDCPDGSDLFWLIPLRADLDDLSPVPPADWALPTVVESPQHYREPTPAHEGRSGPVGIGDEAGDDGPAAGPPADSAGPAATPMRGQDAPRRPTSLDVWEAMNRPRLRPPTLGNRFRRDLP